MNLFDKNDNQYKKWHFYNRLFGFFALSHWADDLILDGPAFDEPKKGIFLTFYYTYRPIREGSGLQPDFTRHPAEKHYSC